MRAFTRAVKFTLFLIGWLVWCAIVHALADLWGYG